MELSRLSVARDLPYFVKIVTRVAVGFSELFCDLSIGLAFLNIDRDSCHYDSEYYFRIRSILKNTGLKPSVQHVTKVSNLPS